MATKVKVFNFSTEELGSFHLVEPAMENAGAKSKESDKDVDLYTKYVILVIYTYSQ